MIMKFLDEIVPYICSRCLPYIVDCQIANVELTGTDYNITKETLILNTLSDRTIYTEGL